MMFRSSNKNNKEKNMIVSFIYMYISDFKVYFVSILNTSIVTANSNNTIRLL